LNKPLKELEKPNLTLTKSFMTPNSACLLTNKVGSPRRSLAKGEVQKLYEQFYGSRLPEAIAQKYLACDLVEFECRESGLRWYEPRMQVSSDYYEALVETFPWYYEFETWDKNEVVSILQNMGIQSFVDVGCGAGKVLKKAQELGIQAYGIDLNRNAVRTAKERGLSVYLPGTVPPGTPTPEALTLLQTIEHVQDPVAFLSEIVKENPCRTLILSAPCHESLLGYSKDPLSWPPHHFTSWTERSFRILGEKVGYDLHQVSYTPMHFWDCHKTITQNPEKFDHLPPIPANRLGFYFLKLLGALGVNWVTREHSIVGVFSRR